MKILLSYRVTDRILYRFHALKLQQQLLPEAIEKYSLVIATDHTTKIDTDLPVIRTECFDKNQYNVSKHTNVIFKYAEEKGFDWIIDGDSDCIFLNKIQQFPRSGLATIPLYYMDDREHIETIIQYRTKYFSDSSIFVVHKSIFSRFKFNEQYSGYGYEDLDYMDTCIRNGIFQGSTDVRGIHLYHSVEERNIDTEANSKNKRLYLERKYSVS